MSISPGRKSSYSPFAFQVAYISSTYSIPPWSSNWKTWVPPPELTAGLVLEATAEAKVCVKFAHWMTW